MKKIIIALLCAFTLFAFASCSGDTPAPGPGTENDRFDDVPELIWGKWSINTGTYITVTKDDIRIHWTADDTEGISLFTGMTSGGAGLDTDKWIYMIYAGEAGNEAKYGFMSPKIENNVRTMTVVTYNEAGNQPQDYKYDGPVE